MYPGLGGSYHPINPELAAIASSGERNQLRPLRLDTSYRTLNREPPLWTLGSHAGDVVGRMQPDVFGVLGVVAPRYRQSLARELRDNMEMRGGWR